MWEPFTVRARRVVVLAQEEAQRLGNNYIGTEHILLGILSEGERIAAKVLETLGVNLTQVRSEVETLVGRGGQTAQQDMMFTPRAKRVIELAFEEARQLNHNYVDSAHLLLGIIREGQGVGARVLANLGIDSASVRAQAVALLESQPPEAVPQRPTVTELYSSASQILSPDASLTPAARHALVAATEASQRCGSPVCTVPHLLFGIAHVQSTKASHALADRGVTAETIDRRLDTSSVGSSVDPDEIALTAGARTTISSAIVAAHSSGRRKANVEHLLLAIAAGVDNDGTQLLQSLGIDLADLSKTLRDHLEGNG